MSLTTGKPIEDVKGEFVSLDFVLSGITEIISLLGIANVSGYISDMNFSVLKQEYLDLGTLIKTRKEDITPDNVRLPEEFFDVPNLYETRILKQETGKKKNNDLIKDTTSFIKDKKKIQNTANLNQIKTNKTYTQKENSIKDIYPKTESFNNKKQILYTRKLLIYGIIVEEIRY